MTDNKVHTVVAINADMKRAVFLLDDGSEIVIKQGDPRLQRLLTEAFDQIEKHKKARINFDDLNVYNEFEQQSHGLVRFFRAVKRNVSVFFDSGKPVVGSVGTIPTPIKATSAAPAPLGTKVETPVLSVPDVATQPAPTTAPKSEYTRTGTVPSDMKNLAEDETIIAVVNGVEIPGIEKIYPYILNAVSRNSPKAVTNFLERISRVVGDRKHSIEDLMRFLEKGDLPLAIDGSIIAYKILTKKQVAEFTYVDVYSKNVTQRVGSYVRIDPSMVDPNRSTECSYGLHVARRGYIRSFEGDVCVLIRMAPEDVIAVPHGDPNKVRVCGYHILAELPKEAYDTLRANKPMDTCPKAMDLLEVALNGGFSEVLEEVWIGGTKGTNLTIKRDGEIVNPPAPVVTPETEEPKVEAVILTDRAETPVVPAVEIAPFAAKARKLAVKAPVKEKPKGKTSHKDEARKLFEIWMNNSTTNNFYALVLYKRTVKKGWSTLGFNQEEIDLISSELPKK